MGINIYRYQETIDWGIIKREWIHENLEWIIVLEQHEEDRFTVKITNKQHHLEYYSYLTTNGKLTFDSLEKAQIFAENQLTKIQTTDHQ